MNQIVDDLRLLTSGALLMITPAMARRILGECRYDRQRPVNEDRVLLLAGYMEHGTFRQNTQLVFVALNGRLYLIDGQHRMHAVDLSGMSQPFRIEVEQCTNEREIDALYCRIDQPGGQRSLTQVSRSLGLHDDAEGGLRPANAALLLRTVPMLMIELQRIPPALRPRSTRDIDAKKTVALDWKPMAIAYQECLDLGVSKFCGRFRNAGVMAVALATFRHQPEKAKEFWAGAVMGDGLSANDPRQALRNDFLVRGRTSHEFDLAETSAMAWNAFMAGRELKILKVLGGPIKLSGTPYGEAQ